MLPSDNEEYVSANAAALESKEVRRLYLSVVNYILEDEIELGVNVPLTDEEDVDEFLKKYDNGKIDDFSNIKNLRFVEPEEILGEISSIEELNKYQEIINEAYGADEAVCVAAIADVGDKTFYYFPKVARYGEKWYIVLSWSALNDCLQMKAYQPFRITDKAPESWGQKEGE